MTASDDIEAMLRGCTLNPPASAAALVAVKNSLPSDYAAFLGRNDGGEGFVATSQYLHLWQLEDIPQLNEAYAVAEFIPHIVLIGTDGGDTAFGYDSKLGQYIRTPIVGMEEGVVDALGGTFVEFLRRLASESR